MVVPIVVVVVVVVEVVIVVVVVVVVPMADIGAGTESKPYSKRSPESDAETRGVDGVGMPMGPGQTDPDAVEKAQVQRE